MSWHAKLSASGTKQWWNCPGSTAYLEQHPELVSDSNEYAREGTVAHHVLEVSLSKGQDSWELLDRIGRIVVDKTTGEETGVSILKPGAEIKNKKLDFAIDENMCEAVQTCIDYTRSRLMAYAGHDDTARAVKENILRLETKVNPLPERTDTGGTGDIAIDIWPELYEIIDYKHGRGVFVPVNENPQLRSYLAGGLHEHSAWEYQELRYTISQPRHMKSPPDGIMSEAVTSKDLKDWLVQLAIAAARVDAARELLNKDPANDLTHLFNKGFVSVGKDGEHCTFCDLKHICPAISAKVQEVAAIDFDDELPEAIEQPGHNQLSVAMHWAPLLEQWIKQVYAAAENELLAGNSLPGFKLVQGKSPGRSLRADKTIEEAIAEALKLGAKEEKLYKPPVERKPKTIVQIETALPKAKRAKFEATYMIKTPGKPVVVREDDPRPPMDINPGADFEDDL